jgi:Flp pilus assembly protein TadB
MTTHSPVAQVEVEMRKIKERIKKYENEYDEATRDEEKEILLKMIIAAETNLHDLSEKLKARQQQGNEQKTRPFILFMVLSFPIDSLVVLFV